ncbi:tetratricopeptide repeat protein [Pseudomonas sp. 148P]|uniref:protein O-GlcNAc transferase n=1 Tax=Pseudomonas ulcerans TaxID=3115852 RepID=A0ABU7HJH2_9PSED|nr:MULTISPECIES: tetratricopeptide repeat protein [unclassified Pseudomonas]MEE1921400.1 tetratricopeptide repeat protein [Pseudomonas sp. 147P]MEE1931683.1 tetratricopeptide repeat protein [Pseudomonas sp. 148P]
MSKPQRARPPQHRPAAPSDLAQARRLCQRRPDDAGAWQTLGNLQLNAEPAQALASFEQALQLQPNDPQALELVAKAAQKLGDADRAEQLASRALDLVPDFGPAHHRLATLYFEKGRFEPALRHIDRALAQQPDNCRLLSRKGLILNRLDRHGEAIAVFTTLIRREPADYSHWNNLANLYKDIGKLDLADEHYRKAIDLAGRKDVLPYSNRLTTLHYDPKQRREYIFAVCKEWQMRFGPTSVPERPRPDNLAPDRLLRIGLVSDGLRQHPVGNMIVGVLEHLPRHQFQLFAYSSSQVNDHLTRRIRARVTDWRAIRHMDTQQLVQQIQDDRIDILIDLSGHNAGNRMDTMALQPAPLLVKWVGGLINTTGLDAIDYLLSDAIESPRGEDAFYTEKLIRLPDDYICYDPPPYAPDIKALPAQANGFVTFGCFNNPTKVNDELLGHWAQVLQTVADSRLLLKGGAFANPELREHVQAVLGEHGIAAERVMVEGPVGHRDLLDSYNRVDIALDPWPYSGGLTTCEALLMGVPVVTLPGPTFAGRHSATHLVNAGLPELVVDSWEAYVERAAGLARDLKNLALIRSFLRRVLMNSPVCDAPRFAGHLGTALRAIWQRYCAGKPATALSLDKEGSAFFEGEDSAMLIQHPPAPASDEGFSFRFQGRIVALDHGATLLGSPRFVALQRLGVLSTIAFDPASRIGNAHQLAELGELHYYANTALGDGSTATLRACLDPALSATLEPLPGATQGPVAQVLARLPVPTIRLDVIEGLDTVDWLLLDNLSDSLALLDHGQRTLADTLLVQARIAFVPTHAGQADLAALSQRLAALGFTFHRLHDLRHQEQAAEPGAFAASRMVCADALFLPDPQRLARLDENRRRKLAFLLHTVYDARDMALQLLKDLDEDVARRYVRHCRLDVSAPAVAAAQAPETPFEEPQLTFPAEVARYVRTLYSEASVILEYGSGGSTILAGRMPGKTVITVENDLRWAKGMQRWIEGADLASPPRIHAVDVGQTGAWARPKDARAWKRFHQYPLQVWDEPFFEPPDVILIDGRFRIACFVTACLRVTRPTIVLFDDYLDRPHYHVVERLVKPTEYVGRMARFDVQPMAGLPREELTWLVASFNEVAYATPTPT